MDPIVDTLDTIAGALVGSFSGHGPRLLDDDSLLLVTAAVENVGRAVDALRVEIAGELSERSRTELGREGLAARKGCRNASELMQRATLISGRSASARLSLGREVRARSSLSGTEFPARFARVADALASGQLGIDSAAAIICGLLPTVDRAVGDDVEAAEQALVAAATGATVDSPVAFTADCIRTQTLVWRARLDPDGLEPDKERALAQRGFSRATLSRGLMRGRYAFLPEIYGKLDRILDACMSPKTAPAFFGDEERAGVGAQEADASTADMQSAPVPRDPRTPDQQRHDILAGIFDMAARSPEVPTIGGAAPTVLVSVRASDLERGRGAGYLDGVDVPLAMTVIKQFACTGGIQTVVLDELGTIVRLGSEQRVFNRQQRRAITVRDGGCIIPGCNVPASWCEIHHVDPAENNGPTHTGNGVLLCWFHHRTIDTSGWEIRMLHGVPQVKAPPWIDRTGRWHPAAVSRTRLAAVLDRPLRQPELLLSTA